MTPCQLMAENETSWLQEDNSWRETTRLRSIVLRRGRHIMAGSKVLCLDEKWGLAEVGVKL